MGDENIRIEKDSLGEVAVPASKLWGAQTQRSLEHFSIGTDLIPRERIAAYATLKKAAASANHGGGRRDEILAGQHSDMFPLHGADEICRRSPQTPAQRILGTHRQG
jgi:fumarate hydratase, class II